MRNFVYVRYRPFHPLRLWKLLYDKFILQLEHDDEDENDTDEDQETNDDCHEKTEKKHDIVGDADDAIAVDTEDTDSASEASSGAKDSFENSCKLSNTTDETAPSPVGKSTHEDAEYCTPDPSTILANKRAHPVFRDLLRSKGGFWFATRPDYRGDWSQAGAMLRITGEMPFFCTLDPEDYLGEDGEINEILQHDIAKGGEWGDRRQEIVFIGLNLQREKISALLDECLLNNEEWDHWQRIMRDEKLDGEQQSDALNDIFDDGWPDWPIEFEYGHGDEGDDWEDDDYDESGAKEEDDHRAPLPAKKKARSISAYKEKLEEIS